MLARLEVVSGSAVRRVADYLCFHESKALDKKISTQTTGKSNQVVVIAVLIFNRKHL